MAETAVAQLIASDRLTIVVGLGATGLSVARFLTARGERFMVVDSRAAPPGLPQLRAAMPDVPVELGALNAQTLARAGRLSARLIERIRSERWAGFCRIFSTTGALHTAGPFPVVPCGRKEWPPDSGGAD